MTSTPIQATGQFVPPIAAAFADSNGNAAMVSANQPMPVLVSPPITTPLTGTATGTAQVGPFDPVVGRSVILTLTGTWAGGVQLMRSTDNGVTVVPVTLGGAPWAIYTTNCCEPVWDESEAAALLYLQITLSSGSVNYRLAQ